MLAAGNKRFRPTVGRRGKPTGPWSSSGRDRCDFYTLSFGKRQFQLADPLRTPIFKHENPLSAIFGCLRSAWYHNLCLSRGVQKPHHHESAPDDDSCPQSLSEALEF